MRGLMAWFRRALDQQRLSDLQHTREELLMAREEIDRQIAAVDRKIQAEMQLEEFF